MLVYQAPDPRFTPTSTVGNRVGFQGHEKDLETGLANVRNRYYDPEIGRFITADPMGYVDGPSMYQFAGYSPVSSVDPLGLQHDTQFPIWQAEQSAEEAEKPQSVSLEGLGAQPIVIEVGRILKSEAELRLFVYEKGLEAIRQEVKWKIADGMAPERAFRWGSEARENFQNLIRDESSPLSRYFAEKMKPRGSVSVDALMAEKGVEEAIEGLGRARLRVHKWAVASRLAGYTMLVVSAGISAYEIIDAKAEDRWRIVARESGMTLGSIGGGWAGAIGGAKVGGALGTGAEPGGVQRSVRSSEDSLARCLADGLADWRPRRFMSTQRPTSGGSD